MRSPTQLLALLFLFFIATPIANACTCGGNGSPCESFGTATAVFVGTPIATRTEQPKPEKREDYFAPRTFKFSVEQAYLGVTGTEIEVSTGFGGGDCGYSFELGQRYLVYAYRYESGQLGTSICTSTKPFSKARDDLAFLGNLSSAAPGATIHGHVAYNQSDNGSSLGPDVSIVIEGENVRREVRLDAEGKYRVSGLQPGKFKVILKIPDTLTTYQTEHEVSVVDRGCAAMSYYVKDNGRISGSVVDYEGRRVPKVMLALIQPNSDPKKEYVDLASTDDQGVFNFSGIPPGRYLIAANFRRFPEPGDPTLAYPPVYYPSVVDQPSAEVITLKVGEKLSDYEIRLPPRRPASVLAVQIVWEDGTPAPALVVVKDVTEHKESEVMGHGFSADEQGKFTLYGYVGQKLILEGQLSHRYVGTSNSVQPRIRSERVQIKLERPNESVKIVMTRVP